MRSESRQAPEATQFHIWLLTVRRIDKHSNHSRERTPGDCVMLGIAHTSASTRGGTFDIDKKNS